LKYLILSLVLFLTSCSTSRDTTYLNEDLIKIADDYEALTFDEFNLFLKEYSKNAEYPDINK
jgi:hypothetical protein